MGEERFKGRRTLQPLLASLGLVALLVFIAACGSGGAGSKRANSSGENRESGAVLGNPILGDEDAPVLMIEYADFQ